jgi:hypothetical protein
LGGSGLSAGTGEALTLKEESGLVGNEVAGQILRSVHTTGDERSPEVGTLEQIKKGRFTTHLTFDYDSSLYHSKCLFSLFWVLVAETFDGLEGLVSTAITNQPPRRLGAQENKD